MGIEAQLSFSLGHKDQGPNRALAKRIVNEGGETQLKELVDFFLTSPHKDLQKDAILTIAWVSEEAPEMVTPYSEVLLNNFISPINRVIWGSMIALAHIAHLIPTLLFEALPRVLDTMNAGTVVTRDYGFRILLSLYVLEDYQEDLNVIMLEVIHAVPDNQLGQYAEKWTALIAPDHKAGLIRALEGRRPELSDVYHKRRIDKILKKLHK